MTEITPSSLGSVINVLCIANRRVRKWDHFSEAWLSPIVHQAYRNLRKLLIVPSPSGDERVTPCTKVRAFTPARRLRQEDL